MSLYLLSSLAIEFSKVDSNSKILTIPPVALFVISNLTNGFDSSIENSKISKDILLTEYKDSQCNLLQRSWKFISSQCNQVLDIFGHVSISIQFVNGRNLDLTLP